MMFDNMPTLGGLSICACLLAGCAGTSPQNARVSPASDLFARTCLASLGDFGRAPAQFQAAGLTPRGGEFVDASGRLVGALSRNKRGCVITETGRQRLGATPSEERDFLAALRRVEPSVRALGPGQFTPFPAAGAVFVPFLKSEGTIAGGDARLIRGILRAR